MSDKISVLIVDDEMGVRVGFEQIFKEFSCKILESERKAVDLLLDGYVPDVAIIDLLIPYGGKYPELDQKSYHMTAGARLSKYIVEKTEGRCRTILLTDMNRYRDHASESKVWGYIDKGHKYHMGILFEVAKWGPLKDWEIGQPTINIRASLEHEGEVQRERGL
jgi:DNA-binding NarL/FixJ family response regulator